MGRQVIHRSIEAAQAQLEEGGLGRLRLAHTLDLLEEAREAWANAGTGLTTTIRGLTRAPAAYADATARLIADDTDSPTGTEQALLTALPSLAHDAAQAVDHLTNQGNLVTLQREPLTTHKTWRPISPDSGRQLTAEFRHAERTSRRANAAIHALDHPGKTPTPGTPRTERTHQPPGIQPPGIEAPSCIR